MEKPKQTKQPSQRTLERRRRRLSGRSSPGQIKPVCMVCRGDVDNSNGDFVENCRKKPRHIKHLGCLTTAANDGCAFCDADRIKNVKREHGANGWAPSATPGDIVNSLHLTNSGLLETLRLRKLDVQALQKSNSNLYAENWNMLSKNAELEHTVKELENRNSQLDLTVYEYECFKSKVRWSETREKMQDEVHKTNEQMKNDNERKAAELAKAEKTIASSLGKREREVKDREQRATDEEESNKKQKLRLDETEKRNKAELEHLRKIERQMRRVHGETFYPELCKCGNHTDAMLCDECETMAKRNI